MAFLRSAFCRIVLSFPYIVLKLITIAGELYAHFNCAAWSDGVTKTFEKLLSNVDKAVVTAAFQVCCCTDC